MSLLDNATSLEGIAEKKCKTVLTMNVTTIAVYMLGFFFTVFLCNGLHTLLRPLSQPRIMSEFIVGLFLANTPMVRSSIKTHEMNKTLNYIADFGMVCHMFVLGLEIDHHIFIQPQIREAKVAGTGMISTFVLALIVIPFLHVPDGISTTQFNLSLSIILSGTASPLLTRLITDLKIGKSDIGKFVVSTGVQSDLVSTFLLALGFIVFDPMNGYKIRTLREIIGMVSILVIETVTAAKLSPLIMNWVNMENPEGKPMKGSHLILSVAYVVLVCGCSPTLAGFNSILSAFMAGLFMPREGRISKMMINKVNYFLTTIFYPLFFFWVGAEADLTLFGAEHIGPWARLVLLFVIATVGKVLGTVVSGVILGFHWPETVAIGGLLNIKGHFHVYLAIIAAKNNITSISTSIAMLFATFLTIVYTPIVVANIIERARKHSPTQRMALQWLDPTTELRILLCLRGPQNVPSAINFTEISRGPADPGLVVYFTDMIELTDRVAATLAHGGGVEAVTVTDPAVMDMREEITKAVEAYVAEDSEGISVKRMMALATMNSMHQDICILVEELGVSLLVVPFHKDQQADGRLGIGHTGFRHVNRKVLRHAPCSVGILVDRGLGSLNKISRSAVTLFAAVIFIGGKDDREALACAGRVARHPGIKLTVIRFLLDASSENATSTRPGRPRVNTPEQEEEMKLDDECFADFYDRHVARGHVAYMEKYLVNSGQTFSTLRSMEGQYGLFIVGRGGRVNSVLTVGMNDWEECPELGPIGDILSASDFSVTASVLIIQQHSLRGELAGLDDDFSIM
ncbi:cation/H(+) antiporter 28-like [Actinidia eriantha]|uniref:cation/H(+) antiporter 28-like n=1 Tax=Actinidia eriantha TaxID=165200 RepID=UPI00258531A5|nr:cation/H(+) antiporter 28-like [Actinidia eriantha]